MDADAREAHAQRGSTRRRMGVRLAGGENQKLRNIDTAGDGSRAARLAVRDDHVSLRVIHRNVSRGACGRRISRRIAVSFVEAGGHIKRAHSFDHFAAHISCLRGLDNRNHHIGSHIGVGQTDQRSLHNRVCVRVALRQNHDALALAVLAGSRHRAKAGDLRDDIRLRHGNRCIRLDGKSRSAGLQAGRFDFRNRAGHDVLCLNLNGIGLQRGILRQIDFRLEGALRVREASHNARVNRGEGLIGNDHLHAGVAGGKDGHIAITGRHEAVRVHGSDGAAAAVSHSHIQRAADHSAGSGVHIYPGGVLLGIIRRHIEPGRRVDAARLNAAADDFSALVVAQDCHSNAAVDCSRTDGHTNDVRLGRRHALSFHVQRRRSRELAAALAGHPGDVGRTVVRNRSIDIDAHAAACNRHRFRLGDGVALSLNADARSRNGRAGHVDHCHVVRAQLHIGNARANRRSADIRTFEQGSGFGVHVCQNVDRVGSIHALAQDAGHRVGIVDGHHNCAADCDAAGCSRDHHRLGGAAHAAFDLHVGRIDRSALRACSFAVGSYADVGMHSRRDDGHKAGNANRHACAGNTEQIDLRSTVVDGMDIQVRHVRRGNRFIDEGVRVQAVHSHCDARVHAHAAGSNRSAGRKSIEGSVGVNVHIRDVLNVCAAGNRSFDIALRHCHRNGGRYACNTGAQRAGHSHRVGIGSLSLHIEAVCASHVAIHVSDGLVAQADRRADHAHTRNRTAAGDGYYADGTLIDLDFTV